MRIFSWLILCSFKIGSTLVQNASPTVRFLLIIQMKPTEQNHSIPSKTFTKEMKLTAAVRTVRWTTPFNWIVVIIGGNYVDWPVVDIFWLEDGELLENVKSKNFILNLTYHLEFHICSVPRLADRIPSRCLCGNVYKWGDVRKVINNIERHLLIGQ